MPSRSETSQTRSKASASFSARRLRISSRSQKSRLRSCTHSKYETVTPPAFVRTSGSTGIPRAARIASAGDRRRPVCPFGDEPAAERPGVRLGHLVLARGEHEHVAVDLEQLLVGEPRGREALERSVLARVLVQRRHVEAVRVEDAARDVADARRPPRPSRAARSPRRRRRCRSPGRRTAGRRATSRAARRRARSPSRRPAPVASLRNTEPPIEIGLPVTIPGTA